ncbi:MAG: SDR family NAD(P)-dependent oxidoreductase [Paludibacteraceae bacterium]|nr:SDR family NAD(P)-dependent oxidoreductase [Paludibacteraceae bacterium]
MKNIIITGASGSIGAAASCVLAQQGWHVIMACRDVNKGEKVKAEILCKCPTASVEVRELEMSSPESIRDFAEGLKGTTVNALFNNAGIKAHKYVETAQGIEQNMAVNYIGAAMLTELIVPLIPAGGSVVNMVSLTVRFAKLDMNWRERKPEEFSQLGFYSTSKLAFLYYSIGLARRCPHLSVNVSDPGIVNSNMITMGHWYDPLADIFFRPFIKTPEQGAEPSLNALNYVGSLQYFVGRKHSPIAGKYVESPLVEQLWQQLGSYLRT